MRPCLLGALLFIGCSAPPPQRPPAVEELPPFQPAEPRLRRLTVSQYRNTVVDLFGDGLVLPRALEPDSLTDSSAALGASTASVSLRGAEQYQVAAYELAEQVLRDPERRKAVVPCVPQAAVDQACASQFVSTLGRRLWRRTLEDAEVQALSALATTAAQTLGDFHLGLEYALAALLQSPDFLFRAELAHEGRYTADALAGRLAFLLWDSGPDDALLHAAASGALDSPEGLTAEVSRMLESPKARHGLRAFATDWLRLAELDGLAKDTRLFPTFGPDLAPSAREEVLRLVEALAFEREADFRELLTTRETFLNRRLASLYGVPFPLRDAPQTVFVPVALPESGVRRGLLGTAAVLAGNAHPTSTSLTLRGRFIREVLLCRKVPSAPVELNTAIPEPSATARTLRERVQEHLTNASCRSCHTLMDPLGLGLEQFDAVGRARAMDNGVPVDASGEYEGRRFTDALELTEVLRNHPELGSCITTRLYQYAHGHHPSEEEEAERRRLAGHFIASGHRLKPLLVELVTSEAFRRAAPLTQEEQP